MNQKYMVIQVDTEPNQRQINIVEHGPFDCRSYAVRCLLETFVGLVDLYITKSKAENIFKILDHELDLKDGEYVYCGNGLAQVVGKEKNIKLKIIEL